MRLVEKGAIVQLDRPGGSYWFKALTAEGDVGKRGTYFGFYTRCTKCPADSKVACRGGVFFLHRYKGDLPGNFAWHQV